MKWQPTILLLVYLVAGALRPTDGGGDRLIVQRDPFYNWLQTEPLTVNITNPLQGVTYYGWAASTQDVNVTTDRIPDYCRYRINSNSWNTYDCSSRHVTFPEGEVNLTVEAYDSRGSGSDTVSFKVVIYKGGKVPSSIFLGVYAVFAILAFIIYDNDKVRLNNG